MSSGPVQGRRSEDRPRVQSTDSNLKNTMHWQGEILSNACPSILFLDTKEFKVENQTTLTLNLNFGNVEPAVIEG